MLEYGDEKELYIVVLSFNNEYLECPLTDDQLVNGYFSSEKRILNGRPREPDNGRMA